MDVLLCNKNFSPIFILIMGGWLKVYGRDNIKKGESYVYMANHTSFSDIPILFASTRERLHFMAKEELKRSVFGVPIRKMRMIFVDRSNSKNSVESMRKAALLVKGGRDLAVFPEGTRSKDGKLGTFKKGSFKLALHAGVKIIPVGISGASTIVARNNIKYRPSKVIVKIGEPIDTKSYSEETLGELADLVRSKIVELT
ncbi:MAG: 1-acyl-sn-glycerol-3-phosphate acyltransferase [Bacteroidales bacterium]|nr:1-acyl-sn-glycerol-3-phosphate acyltransferase [Bacteroidales bacterium]